MFFLSCTKLTDVFRFVQTTGQKALYVNPGFTKRIVGLKHEESEALLNLLYTVSTSTLPVLMISMTLVSEIGYTDKETFASTSTTARTSRSASSGKREPSRSGTTA